MSTPPAGDPRVGPDQVGRRVVLRRRLPDPQPGALYGDVLGELLSWDGVTAVVRTRAGDDVSVPVADVVAGKEVPPPARRKAPPHLALDVAGLEEVASDGWRPLEGAWLADRPGGWRLRASAGFTGRANSVLPLGEPGVPLEEAVDRAERWYAERGLPPRFAVPWPLDAPVLPDRARDVPLDAALRRRGYVLDTPTLVLVAPLAVVAAAADVPAVRRVELAEEPDEEWLSVYRYRGQELPPVARELLLSAPAQAFASVRDGSATVAVGRVAVSRGWAGITAMDVARTHRRQGLGRAVLAALAGWAVERGAVSSYLQVAEHNQGAQALYAAAGYVPHHGYHYRIHP